MPNWDLVPTGFPTGLFDVVATEGRFAVITAGAISPEIDALYAASFKCPSAVVFASPVKYLLISDSNDGS